MQLDHVQLNVALASAGDNRKESMPHAEPTTDSFDGAYWSARVSKLEAALVDTQALVAGTLASTWAQLEQKSTRLSEAQSQIDMLR